MCEFLKRPPFPQAEYSLIIARNGGIYNGKQRKDYRPLRNTNSEIKQTEKLLHERKELIDQAEKYLQYRDYHKTYKQTKPKKQEEYAERYRTELALYDRAERYLKEHLGSDTADRTGKGEVKNTRYIIVIRLRVWYNLSVI